MAQDRAPGRMRPWWSVGGGLAGSCRDVQSGHLATDLGSLARGDSRGGFDGVRDGDVRKTAKRKKMNRGKKVSRGAQFICWLRGQASTEAAKRKTAIKSLKLLGFLSADRFNFGSL